MKINTPSSSIDYTLRVDDKFIGRCYMDYLPLSLISP